MNTYTSLRKVLGPLSLITCFATAGSAQSILFNNGATIFTATGAIVQVNGGLQNDQATGLIDNNGTMTVANSGTAGTVWLTNASTLQGDGLLRVQQDFVNDAVFIGDNGTVELFGDLQQDITSTTGVVTTFNNLTLTGAGTGTDRKKTLNAVNANIGPNGILTINDRELETLTNTLFVLNPSTAAVTNNTTFGSEGFVSSSFGGTMSRVTNTSSAYLFPTGSSAGTLRYRPVTIAPATAAANTFTVRLGNNTATLDGFDVTQFDTSMCRVTSLFYHQIQRSAGTDNAAIDIFYDQVADGPWDGLAQWNTPVTALWNNMGTVTQTTGTLNDLLKLNWSDFSNSPYILSRAKLADPVFACNDVCANSPGNTFTATGASSGAGYTWITPSGTTITSGQGTSTVSVDWNSTSGPVTVYSTNSVGCYSDSVSCVVNVSMPPVADFDSVATGFDYSFTDQSTGGATNWMWSFGDGSTSSVQNPTHQYTANGTYTVCLVASNNQGCADSTCRTLDVVVDEFINIPNVFTPDGDNVNDFFTINNSGLKEFNIEIYNRWGTKLFESDMASNAWDGRTTAGVPVSDGTYFYILKAVSVTGKDYGKTGFINLLRKP